MLATRHAVVPPVLARDAASAAAAAVGDISDEVVMHIDLHNIMLFMRRKTVNSRAT